MYQFKEVYTLDFSNVENYLEMHFVIRDALDWPDYYGCNWDAFWDCLNNMLGRPIHVEIIGLDNIERKFGETTRKMLDILREFKHCENNKYADEIRIILVSGDIKIEIQ
ncbi:MAG: barstar family protein [Clostridia bacterium]|nr:barstar family protein [Clostridia bacterium]